MNTRRPFAAKYPGRCLCGATFEPGARIFWDSNVRRATLCPSCRPARAVKGQWTQDGSVDVRIDTHPQTGEAVIVCLSIPEEFGRPEVYQKRNGRWGLRSGMVFARAWTHDEIAALVERVSMKGAA